ncbi:MAG: hypothetical protein ACON5B_14845 [Myxococcota bacterium]
MANTGNSPNILQFRRAISTEDLGPIVARTIRFLQHNPRGASRVDILAAMQLQPQLWNSLRTGLEQSGEVVSLGRGPGLRHVHIEHADHEQLQAQKQNQGRARIAQLAQARRALVAVLQENDSINSAEAQAATGLPADPVRRLLLELVRRGRVERAGLKRSTRYRWIG